MCMFPALAATVALLRIGLNLNKYVVWAIMSVAVQYARRTTPIVPDADRLAGWPEWAWPVLAVGTLAIAFSVFVRKNAAREAARAKAEAAEAAEATRASSATASDTPTVASTPLTSQKVKVG